MLTQPSQLWLEVDIIKEWGEVFGGRPRIVPIAQYISPILGYGCWSFFLAIAMKIFNLNLFIKLISHAGLG